MLEERVKSILEKIAVAKKIEDVGSELTEKEYRNNADIRIALQAVQESKQKLGQDISSIRQNIIVEVDGKSYCLFYNQKYGTASVVPALSVEEAEIEMTINRIKNSDERF